MREKWMHFLGQVNTEKVCLLEGDAPKQSANITQLSGNQTELVLWYLTSNMTLPADRKAFAKTLERLLGELPQGGRLALFWDNPFSVHAFCGGFLETTSETGGAEGTDGLHIADTANGINAALSYVNMKEMLHCALTESGAGERAVRWFYPYPSVSFTTHIFSDERLPQPGECEDNDYNFRYARLESFDEKKTIDAIAAAGLYPQLAHAYLVVIGGNDMQPLPDFARLSMQRREERQIITNVYRHHVEKTAFYAKAGAHVSAMAKWEEPLNAWLSGVTVLGRRLTMNHVLFVKEQEGRVGFAFAKGKSMEQFLDEMLAEGRRQEVCEVLLDFCAAVRKKADRPFIQTEEFTDIFGIYSAQERIGIKSLPITDIDLVCQNILIADNGAEAIDYEWTFDFPVPVDFYIYRFLYLYLEAKNRAPFDMDFINQIYEKAEITSEMRRELSQMETHFQHYVQSGAYVLRNAFEEEGGPVLRASYLQKQLRNMEKKALHVVYRGGLADGGTKDSERLLYGSRDDTGIRRFLIPACGDQTMLKQLELQLTGCGQEALLRIGMMRQKDGKSSPCAFETNGRQLGGFVYLYRGIPALTVNNPAEDEIFLLSIEEIGCSKDAAGELERQITDLSFLLENREQQLLQMRESASWKLTAPLRRLRGQEQ